MKPNFKIMVPTLLILSLHSACGLNSATPLIANLTAAPRTEKPQESADSSRAEPDSDTPTPQSPDSGSNDTQVTSPVATPTAEVTASPTAVATASPTATATATATASPAQNATCTEPPRAAGEFRNIKYQSLNGVSDNLQSLDIYTPAITDPCKKVPVVIWVHGGAWMIGDKANMDSKIEFYRSLGYVLVSVNYRLSPNVLLNPTLVTPRVMFPDHPNDVGAAVAWVRKNIATYGGNPVKLALAGHSAGAHLVALVSTDQSYIRKADPSWQSSYLKCTGSYDTEGYDIPFTMSQTAGPSASQVLIYKNAFGDLMNTWTQASPKTHLSVESPAFQFAKRGDQARQSVLMTFSSLLQGLGKTTSIINASSLTHEEVNSHIGAMGDTVMTPFVRAFMTRVCFPE